MTDYLTPLAVILICAAVVFVGFGAAAMHKEIRRMDGELREMEMELIDIQLRHREFEPGFKKRAAEAVPSETGLTDFERDLVAGVCHTEAEGEGLDGMMAVAQVVKNRLSDGRFGGEISDVCTPEQFHGLRQMQAAPCHGAYQAVDLVFGHGRDGGVGGALYFCTASTNPDAIKKGLVAVARVKNHVFYGD